MRLAVPRLVLAAPASGAGKTTVAAALAAACTERGLRVACFKVGPDYIDPGHLAWASGQAARNLDTWLLGSGACLELFARAASGADLALVEGVMGLFDGRGGQLGGPGSTADLARLLRAPVVLVLDARGSGPSLAALVRGFAGFDPGLGLSGVLVNRAGSPAHAALLREAIASGAPDAPVLGWLPRSDELALPVRPLGLLTAAELGAAGREGLRRRLGAWPGGELDLEALLRLAATAPALDIPAPRLFAGEARRPRRRIALAQDAAFQFYYADALELLAWRGVEWLPFSPLADPSLPAGAEGVYLGGGFPERHLPQLAANRTVWSGLGRLDVYAECGGLMALARAVVDADGRTWPQAGLLPTTVRVGRRRAALGYREAEVLGDGLFLRRGDRLRGHEFHYSAADPPSGAHAAYRLRTSRGEERAEGFRGPRLLASYLHLHLAAHPELADRWAAGAGGAGAAAAGSVAVRTAGRRRPRTAAQTTPNPRGGQQG